MNGRLRCTAASSPANPFDSSQVRPQSCAGVYDDNILPPVGPTNH